MTCDHASTKVRLRTQADGQQVPWVQCLRCGAGIRAVARKDAPSDVDHLLWDEELPLRWRQLESERWALERAALLVARDTEAAEWFKKYEAYLHSPEWQALRRKTLERARGLCEGCRERPATEVHHLTYDHVGEEMLWDLVATCEPCHAKCTRLDRERRQRV